ncbi:alpha/beta hydrolase [Achromobacter ruhlandii]|uniref:Alpha/beta hydrolase n=1 Tax=Achromobacter ruhlandii TaxID=72557 RepID=A0A848NLR4_9BURK|nr:alpha/beta hydrolase [Achromobacter ruhlandii]NMU91503.1 alpha/beta hydrolase [Achromobacter ruhlandii]
MSSWIAAGPRGLLAITVLATLALGLLAACSPLTLLNGAVPDDASRVTAGVAYGPLPRQRLDIYRPPAVTRAPVVVFFYGGSWRSGDRADYRFVGDALAARGIVAVVADYRLYPEAGYPDFLRDAAMAVAWTQRHIDAYGGDPARVFVAGHSAGGYIAAMLALDGRWLGGAGSSPATLAGWIGLAGPYDFLPIVARDVRPVFGYPATPADSQPIHHASLHAPPGLLLTGVADTTVDPRRNSVGLAQALREAGACARLVQYPDLGHKLLVGALSRPLRWRAPVLDDLGEFVARPCPGGQGE